MAHDKTDIVLLPEGRLINHSLFERSVFQKDEKSAPGKPMYTVEIAFDPKQVSGEGTVEDKLADAIEAKWGATHAQNWLDNKHGYWSPLHEGDEMAAKRAEKGKEGDAYKGLLVIRANTAFNKDGKEAPGGLAVYGPDATPIGVMQQDQVYQGCYGIAAVTIDTYEAANGDKSVKFYLKAFQKTRDGEKLTAPRPNPFKPVEGAAPAEGVRRRRAG